MKLANGLEVSLISGVTETWATFDHMQYLAADSDGEVFAFEHKPYLPKLRPEECNVHVWDTLEGDMDYVGTVVMPKDATYEQTLATLTVI